MIRNKPAHKLETNFWSGLSLGVFFGAASLFFLGTKKGRAKVKQLLESLEDFEDVAGDIVEDVRTYIEENENHLDSTGKIPDKIREVHEETHLQSIIDKIQSVLPEKREIKKYFFDRHGSPKNSA